jgi:hypothetical protein
LDALNDVGLTVKQTVHALDREGRRYFGMMEAYTANEEFSTIVGLRNAHDKMFSAGLVIGAAVTVCSNLWFSGEIKLGRRHTAFIVRDLPLLIKDAVSKISAVTDKQEQRIAHYKATKMRHAKAHDVLVKALDEDVIVASKLPRVLKEWREPRHNEFTTDGFTFWRLHNAFTEVMKKTHVFKLPAQTQRLNALMDRESGFQVAA